MRSAARIALRAPLRPVDVWKRIPSVAVRRHLAANRSRRVVRVSYAAQELARWGMVALLHRLQAEGGEVRRGVALTIWSKTKRLGRATVVLSRR